MRKEGNKRKRKGKEKQRKAHHYLFVLFLFYFDPRSNAREKQTRKGINVLRAFFFLVLFANRVGECYT